MTRLEPQGYFKQLFQLLSELKVSNAQRHGLSLHEGSEQALRWLTEAKEQDTKVLLVGNGGSAAIVSHLQNDLSKALGIRAMVFHDTPTLTALSNDESYEEAFAYNVGLWAEPGDLLLAISSSGNSENILKAVDKAHSKGMRTITFSGFKANNALRQRGDLNFYIACESYGLTELSHEVLGHYFVDALLADQKQHKKHREAISLSADTFKV